ncbi:unnamed protein product [Sphagnum jensenii]|uniref:Protein kinase domain-containing protein n=1 Tax=Sphagnum jensenii TaxID=128206 RepID=A0ABP0WNN0_9BRYO
MDNDDDDDTGQILVGNGGNPDDDAQEEEEVFYQKACFLASLVLRIGKACGIEALRKNCRLFPVTSLEVAALCELPKSPLRLSISSKDAATAASATLVDVSPSFLLQLQGSLRRLRAHKEVQVSPAGHHHHHHQHGPHGCGAGTAASPPPPPPPPLLVQNPPLLSGAAAAAAAALQGSDNNNKQKLSKPKHVPEFRDYVVEGEEGTGGYGTVYRVKRKGDGQLFAIKCPLEKTTLNYVNHEIRMLQRVGGKHCITRCEDVIHEEQGVAMEDDGGHTLINKRPNLVLQYIEHDKPEVLRKEITFEELQQYGFCLFTALAHLHKQGIVHRDVKPGNFLFSRKQRLGYLVDFNLAMTMPPCERKHKLQQTAIIIPKVSVAEERQMLGDDNICKKSVAADSSSKAAVVLNSHAAPPPSGSQEAQLSSKPAICSRGACDGSAPNLMLGELAWMPQTVSVLKYAQYFNKNRSQSPATTTATTSNPPASQRKRVAASQHKNQASTRVAAAAAAGVSLPKGPAKGGRQNLVRDGPCAGTKGYRAPEVLLKSNMQTTKLDIWSAGVSLLQLVAGKAPFPSSSSEQALKDIAKLRGTSDLHKLATVHGCKHKLPPGLQSLSHLPLTVKDWVSSNARRADMRDKLPNSLCDLLEKCLQVDPNNRIDATQALCHEFFSPCHLSSYHHDICQSLSNKCS